MSFPRIHALACTCLAQFFAIDNLSTSTLKTLVILYNFLIKRSSNFEEMPTAEVFTVGGRRPDFNVSEFHRPLALENVIQEFKFFILCRYISLVDREYPIVLFVS